MANQDVDSLKTWQVMGDAISWDASQPMLPTQLGHTMGVSHWCLQECLFAVMHMLSLPLPQGQC